MTCKIVGVMILFLTLSCSSQKDVTTVFSGNVMTIDYRVLIGKALSDDQQQHVQKTIDAVFNEVNSIYNKWNPQSELSVLNDYPVNTPFLLSPELEKLLLLTSQIVQITDGRFDPTIESIQRHWKQGKVPSNDLLKNLAVGWHHLQFSPGQVTKLQDVKLDLGGIAKGYAVDLLLQSLQNNGFTDVYVEWGGEIAVIGKHPIGRPWTVYISQLDDTDPEHAIAVLPLRNQAIATSGDYLQQWKIENDVYFHIIDPRTKQPLKSTHTSIASASVQANTCAFADGLATAAMMFSSVEEAQKWLETIREQFSDIKFWIASRG